MICMYIHTIYCPKCEIFKYGVLYRSDQVIESDYNTGYKIVKDVCDAVGIPLIDLDIGSNYEIESLLTIKSKEGRIEDRWVVGWNPSRYLIHKLLDMPTIELPGFLIVPSSKKVRSRYVSVEIVTEARTLENIVISHFVAARQILRAILRTYIEEVLSTRFNYVPHEVREQILSKVMPRENGRDEPNTWDWIRAFIKVKNVVIR